MKNLLGRLCVAGASLASFAVMFSVNPAQAASITQSISSPMSDTDWETTLNFNKFDSSLGILNQVDILMNATVIGSGSIRNNGSSTAVGTATLSSQVELFDSNSNSLGFVQPIFTDRFRTIDSTALAAGNTRNYSSVTASKSQNFSYTDALTLAYFTGAGQGSLTAIASGVSGWTGSSNITANFSTHASAAYTVIYTYSAPAPAPAPAPVPNNTQAVPEPLTILGALTAVGFGVAFKRYATKVNGNLQSASL
jgi:hypothetical protein